LLTEASRETAAAATATTAAAPDLIEAALLGVVVIQTRAAARAGTLGPAVSGVAELEPKIRARLTEARGEGGDVGRALLRFSDRVAATGASSFSRSALLLLDGYNMAAVVVFLLFAYQLFVHPKPVAEAMKEERILVLVGCFAGFLVLQRKKRRKVVRVAAGAVKLVLRRVGEELHSGD